MPHPLLQALLRPRDALAGVGLLLGGCHFSGETAGSEQLVFFLQTELQEESSLSGAEPQFLRLQQGHSSLSSCLLVRIKQAAAAAADTECVPGRSGLPRAHTSVPVLLPLC